MSMSNPTLKLVHDEQPTDVIPLERRCALRRSAGGQVTVVHQTSGEDDGPGRIGSIQLVDMSDTGIGGVSSAPLAEGAFVQLYFPPHGGEPGFEACGQVARCRTRLGTHHVGIQLARRVQAA